MVTCAASSMRPPPKSIQDDITLQLQNISMSDPFSASTPRRLSSSSRIRTRAHESEKLTFTTFAAEWRLHRLQENRIELLKQQQSTLERVLALCARLARTVVQVQDGLTETLKNGDKTGFGKTYNETLDLRDACSSIWNRNSRPPDFITDDKAGSPLKEPDRPTFLHRVPAGSRVDLLDFIHLLRTSPSFLVDRIKWLNPSQISALASFPNKMKIAKDPVMSSLGRSVSQGFQQKQNAAVARSLVETAWSLERTTPLSVLLFDIYSAVSEPDTGDYLLRLNTWSSTCAALYSHSDQTYHFLLIETLNAFASLHEWRAKPRIELFLMNLLQTGAFLLESGDDCVDSKEYPFPTLDPLWTREAETFFDNAVRDLFAIISDSDAGLPFGALHFGSAVLGKIESAEAQGSFRGFLLYSWYFREYLFSAIKMPEAKGMLLHYHVSQSAREHILKEVASRVQSKFAEFLDPMSSPSPIQSAMQDQFQQMVSCLIEIGVSAPKPSQSLGRPHEDIFNTPRLKPTSLVLSVSDIIMLIDMLVPQPPTGQTPWEPFLNSSATAFAAQYRHGLPPLAKIYPSGTLEDSALTQKYLPSGQSSAITLARKFDLIRKDLLAAMERKDVYPVPPPAQDSWTMLDFDARGYPLMSKYFGSPDNISDISAPVSFNPGHVLEPAHRNLDTVQEACLRLLEDDKIHNRTPRINSGTESSSQAPVQLVHLFRLELDMANKNSDSRNAHYWWTAIDVLHNRYMSSILSGNDSRILQPILSASREKYRQAEEKARDLEFRLRYLEEGHTNLSDAVSNVYTELDRLRDKMWYLADITNSQEYEDTKNVAQALKNMALPIPQPMHSPTASIRSRHRPKSLAESLISEPGVQTMSIMKASLEQGGPKKLADEQADLTSAWLKKCNIDNFCKGEERIHRFCMEIRTAAGKLVGESMLAGPVLWSSGLYCRQRTFADGLVTRSMPGSSATRPSSIMSEEGPSLYHQPYHNFRAFDPSGRPPPFDAQSSPGRKSSIHSLGSERWRVPRDFTPSADASSTADSPGRAVSATTDSVSSFWSPFPSQCQSGTSVSSMPSRPPSFITDGASSRLVEPNGPRRTKFLEDLRQRVIGLLLSDLGSPVWSCGSETDAWLVEMLDQNPSLVAWQLQKREGISKLLENKKSTNSKQSRRSPKTGHPSQKSGRSMSVGPMHPRKSEPHHKSKGHDYVTEPDGVNDETFNFPYLSAYEALMVRFSRQTDPVLKLAVLDDLRSLVVSSIREAREMNHSISRHDPRETRTPYEPFISAPTSRRSSWVPGFGGRKSGEGSKRQEENFRQPCDMSIDDQEVINEIKLIFIKTRPKTLFRDLQFITAFVPSDLINRLPGKNALYLVGVAALAFKDEVCRSLVSVADKITVNNNQKRMTLPADTAEYSLRDAAQMWIHAAKEGNAVAQRELAILYLSNPEILPSVSLPLMPPRDIFQSEIKCWSDDEVQRRSSQALCLALHWMQQAANNGDAIAQQRLQERGGQVAFR